MAGAAPATAFGQAVIGPPGSGKTTYCLGMSEFLRALGRRVAVVNLDPANEGLPYECAVDVGELVGLGDVMDALRLGPNGGLLYCMEYLEANLDWLRAKLDPLRGHYFLFDCPGQVELCTHHGALRSIFSQMAQWDLRVRLGLGRSILQVEQLRKTGSTVKMDECRKLSTRDLTSNKCD
uniref:GPN-loop GTPase 2 n=1 Tax=Marmota marmota marmota TaxID=9994 RepID=A0A8C6ETT3_MARMA